MTSTNVSVRWEAAEVPEWDELDRAAGVLGRHVEAQATTDEEIAALLDEVRITLPADITSRDLVDFARSRSTPLGEALVPDLARYKYTLVELPLNVLVPEGRRLVRLRLRVGMKPTGEGPVVAYDLFPPDRWSVKERDFGHVGLDVSKLFTFVFPVPVSDALDLKLDLPLRWTSRWVQVKTSDRMSNPVEWEITDSAIADGLTAYLIVRGALGGVVTLDADLVVELRGSGPFGPLKGRFRQKGDHQYVLS